MAVQKPSIPKGTRDFSPTEMARRNFILDTIKTIYQRYGFQQIETPAMENLSTLEGKYGEEGDKLLFRILDSGDYFSSLVSNSNFIIDFFQTSSESIKLISLRFIQSCINDSEVYDSNLFATFIANKLSDNSYSGFFGNIELLRHFLSTNYEFLSYRLCKFFQFKGINTSNVQMLNSMFQHFQDTELRNFSIPFILNKLTSNQITPYITEKGLRYDLTVPFARYVVMHQNEITFPFKRFQMQPVWRADRPQKGRYREFVQCDADVIGSTSLLNEVELVQIIQDVFEKLNVGVAIKINNRKILSGIADVIGEADKIIDLTVAIDKLDKIGIEKVNEELKAKGLSVAAIEKIQPLFSVKGSNEEKLSFLKTFLSSNDIGKKGIEEVEYIFNCLTDCQFPTALCQLDLTLARGLNYYTGAIFEVKVNDPRSTFTSSVLGGGRYDDLTGIFGLPNVSGVGISFGIDRIYDVMDEMKLFDALNVQSSSTKVFFVNFGGDEEKHCLNLLRDVRNAGINAEIFPDSSAKMKKQMGYADANKIPFVVLVGSEEMQSGKLTLKNMQDGNQTKVTIQELLSLVV